MRVSPRVKGDDGGLGIALLAEAGIQAVIIETTSTGVAKANPSAAPRIYRDRDGMEHRLRQARPAHGERCGGCSRAGDVPPPIPSSHAVA